MVVQYLHKDMDFDSPFLIVYIGTSLFSIFLPMRYCYERWGNIFSCCCRCCCCGRDGEDEKDIAIIPWKNDFQQVSTMRQHDGFVDVDGDRSTLMPSDFHNDNAIGEINVATTNMGVNGVEMRIDPRHLHPNQPASPSRQEALSNDFSNETFQSSGFTASHHHYEPTHSNNSNYLLSHQDHISMASKVAPLWFLSNYFYAMSLEWTSISSSTVLASMGSLFAFGFATCSEFGDEKVTKGKMVGVILCFMGGVATTLTDVGSNADASTEGLRRLRYLRHPASHLPHMFDITDSSVRSLWGDIAGLVSAIGYGLYTVLLRYLCPKDEDRMSMQLFFGYVGLLNMIILLPVAIWVIYASNNNDSAEAPSSSELSHDDYPNNNDGGEMNDTTNTTIITWSIFMFLLFKGLLDNVLSDYLWARAVILTSATVASVGVGLTIPMAFAADWVMGNGDAGGKGEVLGAIMVLFGFVFVNIDVFGEKSNETDDETEEVEFEINTGIDSDSVHDAEILL
jgi:solute carrier family 35 protein F5